MPPAQAPPLRLVSQEIRRCLESARDLPERLEQPNLPAARQSAALFRDCFHALSAYAELESAIGRVIDSQALYASFDALLTFRAGEITRTVAALLETWVATSLAELPGAGGAKVEMLAFPSALQRELEASRGEVAERPGGTGRGPADASERAEWLLLFHQAVEQVVASEIGADQARNGLRSLMARLELSQDDLGRMFGVSGETIRRWERGLTTIPVERRSEILVAESGLRRLQDLFRPQRLPTTLRRPAELFDGESALAWILRGRIADVVERYEEALLYQA